MLNRQGRKQEKQANTAKNEIEIDKRIKVSEARTMFGTKLKKNATENSEAVENGCITCIRRLPAVNSGQILISTSTARGSLILWESFLEKA